MSQPQPQAVAAADDPAACLGPTAYIDSDDPAIRDFAAAADPGGGPLKTAVALYYAVRDGIRYDPYGVEMTPTGFRASTCLARGQGFCVTKAALYAACLRARGVPARLGFADVRNHLSTERLRRQMGTDVFVFHGFTEVWLDGRWVKATPAFNLALCQKFGVRPLEFDGRADSVFHPFDAAGRRHMEYVRERGARADVPFDEIRVAFAETYPGMFDGAATASGDFDAEAGLERGQAR